MGSCHGGHQGTGELVELPQRIKSVYSDVREGEQMWQKVSMDEQGTPK